MYNIHPKYGVPREEISCPDCGQIYGHHNTKVDVESELCGPCAKKDGIDPSNFVSADDFISNLLT